MYVEDEDDVKKEQPDTEKIVEKEVEAVKTEETKVVEAGKPQEPVVAEKEVTAVTKDEVKE